MYSAPRFIKGIKHKHIKYTIKHNKTYNYSFIIIIIARVYPSLKLLKQSVLDWLYQKGNVDYFLSLLVFPTVSILILYQFLRESQRKIIHSVSLVCFPCWQQSQRATKSQQSKEFTWCKSSGMHNHHPPHCSTQTCDSQAGLGKSTMRQTNVQNV